jgi:carotenoid cleavage dioxygenase-like enzyme
VIFASYDVFSWLFRKHDISKSVVHSSEMNAIVHIVLNIAHVIRISAMNISLSPFLHEMLLTIPYQLFFYFCVYINPQSVMVKHERKAHLANC